MAEQANNGEESGEEPKNGKAKRNKPDKKTTRARRIKNLLKNISKLIEDGRIMKDDWDAADPFFTDAPGICRTIEESAHLLHEMAIPVPVPKYQKSSIEFGLRKFVKDFVERPKVRATLIEQLFTHEELVPAKDESIHIGNGTTMLLFAQKLLDNFDQYPCSITTDSIEVLGHYYYSGSSKIMEQNVFAFLGKPVDWRSGTVEKTANTEPRHIRTVYLSVTALTKACQFCTRDTASRLRIVEALKNPDVRRVVFVMENTKVGAPVENDKGGGGDIQLADCIGDRNMEVFLVTDKIQDPLVREMLEQRGINIREMDAPTKSEVLFFKVDDPHLNPPSGPAADEAKSKRSSEKDSSQ